MGTDGTLVDQAFVRRVNEFYGVLYGQHVRRAMRVDMPDHGSQRCRLARAGGAGDQNQTLPAQRQVAQYWRRTKLGERRNRLRDGADNRCRTAGLMESVDAEARQSGNVDGEIAFQ